MLVRRITEWSIFFLSSNCGLKVSTLCLGAASFEKGDSIMFYAGSNANAETSIKIMDKFVELGGNFIDTSNAYNMGQSEELLGEWLKQRGNRNDMIITSKVGLFVEDVFNPNSRQPNSHGLSRKHILEAVDGSLKRLQADYIDLYQIHWPDPGTPTAELVRTMDELVRSGKVRHVGAGNVSGWQLQKIVDAADKLGCQPWVTLQSYYSLLGRTCEPDAFTVCKNEGLGVLPWGAHNGGALTNKLQKADKAPPKGTRLEVGTQLKVPFACFLDFDQLKNDEKYWAVREVLDKIAKTLGKTVPRVAIRWLLQTPPVTSVIIGATKVHQLEDNMGAVGWRLTEEEMAELNEVSSTELPYPYRQQALFQRGRIKSPAYV